MKTRKCRKTGFSNGMARALDIGSTMNKLQESQLGDEQTDSIALLVWP